MATKQITVRIEEELLDKANIIGEELKRNSMGIADINTATIVRGALIKFIEEFENEKNGKRKLDVNFKNLNVDELKLMYDIVWKQFCRELLEMEQNKAVARVGQIFMELTALITTEIGRKPISVISEECEEGRKGE